MAKEINIVGAELRCVEYEQRVRELEQELSKTIHKLDLALRSANTYRQRMRGWQDGALESADAFVCRTEQLEQEIARLISANEGWHLRVRELKTESEAWEQENAKLRDELAEIEATTVPSGQYLNVVALYDKLLNDLERLSKSDDEQHCLNCLNPVAIEAWVDGKCDRCGWEWSWDSGPVLCGRGGEASMAAFPVEPPEEE